MWFSFAVRRYFCRSLFPWWVLRRNSPKTGLVFASTCRKCRSHSRSAPSRSPRAKILHAASLDILAVTQNVYAGGNGLITLLQIPLWLSSPREPIVQIPRRSGTSGLALHARLHQSWAGSSWRR
jgi:hypothetical protein